MSRPLVEVEGLAKHFPARRGLLGLGHGAIRAVDGVSFAIARGEVVGLVGESGSGKSTIGRAVLRLLEPTAGSVRFDGVEVTTLGRGELRRLRRRMQIVFQDPYASLDPRRRVEDLVGDVLDIHGLARGAARRARVVELLEQVGLPPEHIDRFPHQFSGGQRQRIGIARALAVAPDFIVADEPVSALDVSVQAQIVNLLVELRRRLGLTMLFISHDLAVVEHLCDRVIVLYLG
ncbi:MAG: ATP-binding cassette domain-containing protein [Alphaproteobacteria bacterium]